MYKPKENTNEDLLFIESEEYVETHSDDQSRYLID